MDECKPLRHGGSEVEAPGGGGSHVGVRTAYPKLADEEEERMAESQRYHAALIAHAKRA